LDLLEHQQLDNRVTSHVKTQSEGPITLKAKNLNAAKKSSQELKKIANKTANATHDAPLQNSQSLQQQNFKAEALTQVSIQ